MFEVETRDGTKARIYANDGGGQYPFHGAIFVGDSWLPLSWSKDGLHKLGQEHELDLVDVWLLG